MRGERDQALAHLMKINSISEEEAEKTVDEAYKIWNSRNDFEWKIKISKELILSFPILDSIEFEE
jgi:hypothetical protein